MTNKSFFVTLMVCWFVGLPNAASAEDKINYRLTWVVEPSSEEIKARSYPKVSKLAQTRLLPRQLFVAGSDIALPNGKKLASAGTQFVALRSEVPIVCNVHKEKAKTVAGKKHFCLVDQDADGNFDSHFAKGRDKHYWYVLAGSTRVSKLETIQPLALTSTPPEEMVDAPILSVKYGRFLDAGNLFQGGLQGEVQSETAVSFFFEVGSSKRMNQMYRACVDEPVEPYGCAPAIFPSPIKLLGLDATVHQRIGEDAVISVESGFEAAEVYMETKMNGYYTISELFMHEEN